MLTPSFKNPSGMTHQFSSVPHIDIARSSFKRPSTYKSTYDCSYLIPFFVDEALPGDTFNLNVTAVHRLNTLLYPLMDNIEICYWFFAVPNRILWQNWKKFQGEQDDPGDSIDYTVPTIAAPPGGWSVGSLGDYFGLPTEVAGLEVNSLHFRAYNAIYNEFFRDQNLIDSVVVDDDDGPDAYNDYSLLKRCKRHDYFTSCLPWPQKGDSIEVPLGTSADVYGTGKALGLTNGGNNFGLVHYSADGLHADTAANSTDVGSSITPGSQPVNLQSVGVKTVGTTGIYADLSTATAATINEWREAFQLQRLLERDARAGSRYTEIIQSHFGISSPDCRMQRPELLGLGRRPLNIEAVPNVAYSASADLGELGAIGYSASSGIGFTKSFDEHCVIIGLMCAVGDITYQQGVDRMWNRQTRYDFYLPVLNNLGEQEVLNREIFFQNTSADDDAFGYQERWSEYRFKNSKITGALRSTYATSLDAWHLSEEFASLPGLNSTFIQDATPLDRVVATPDEHHFKCDMYIDLTCTRPMPVRSVPGMIDHF